MRAVEILFAVDEALGLLAAYTPPAAPAVAVAAARGQRLRLVGGAARPALAPLRDRRRGQDPRRADRPADAQNQARIEQSLRAFVERHLALDDAELQHRCEQAVRSYDPCISCATHFLRLTIDRG